jgi:hypothetical protein
VLVSELADGLGVLDAELLAEPAELEVELEVDEPAVLELLDEPPAGVVLVAVGVEVVAVELLAASADRATPATRVAPRAAPAVATPAAASDARRTTRLGRLGGGVVVMATTIAGAGSSQSQRIVKPASRSHVGALCWYPEAS